MYLKIVFEKNFWQEKRLQQFLSTFQVLKVHLDCVLLEVYNAPASVIHINFTFILTVVFSYVVLTPCMFV